MADTSRKSAERTTALPPLPEFWSAFGTYAAGVEPIARKTARANLELSTLAGQRVSAYAGIPTAMSRCRSPFDVAVAQMAFWQEAGRHYQEASQRLMEVWWGGMLPRAGVGGEGRVEPRDFITFPEPSPDATGDARRHPGGSQRAA